VAEGGRRGGEEGGAAARFVGLGQAREHDLADLGPAGEERFPEAGERARGDAGVAGGGEQQVGQAFWSGELVEQREQVRVC
jgi:hypothetical protein